MRLNFTAVNRVPSYCYVEAQRQDGRTVVIATSPDTDDMGMSVTNAWPLLADEIVKQLGLDPAQEIVWIEHYPERGPKYHRIPENWDQVFMVFDGRHFRMAQDRHPWKSLQEQELQQFLKTS